MAEKNRYQSQREANERYNRKHERRFTMKAYDTKDADMIAWLESKESIGGYLRSLVRADMQRSAQPTAPVVHWYGMRLRECGIGCQPRDFTDHINGSGRTLLGGKYWSLVAYERPLTKAEMSVYSMDEVSAEDAEKERRTK